MSSTHQASAVQEASDPALRSGLVYWNWPAGTRFVLAATAIAAALGLGAAGRTLPRSGEQIVPAPELRLDVNTVPARVLETLPHVGQSLVRQLVAAREVRPLESLDDAGSRVRGLGPATLAQIAPYLRFEPAVVPGLENSEIAAQYRPAAKPRTGKGKTRRPRKQTSVTPLPQLALGASQPPAIRLTPE